MRITYNKRPYTFDGPDNDDIATSIFTQANWKGINENKNQFSTDFESLEDCNNVYVNEDLILSSRPELSGVPVPIDKNSQVFKTQTHIIVYNKPGVITVISYQNRRYEMHEVYITGNLYVDFDKTSKVYFYEINNVLFVFTDVNIYKIVWTGDEFELVSALSNVYIPDHGDAKNLLVGNATKYKDTFSADQFNDVEVQVPSRPNLAMETSYSNRPANWNVESFNHLKTISAVRYTMLNRITNKYTGSATSDFIVINNTPYLIDYSASLSVDKCNFTVKMMSLYNGIWMPTAIEIPLQNKPWNTQWAYGAVNTYKSAYMWYYLRYYISETDTAFIILRVDFASGTPVFTKYEFQVSVMAKDYNYGSFEFFKGLFLGSDNYYYVLTSSKIDTTTVKQTRLLLHKLDTTGVTTSTYITNKVDDVLTYGYTQYLFGHYNPTTKHLIATIEGTNGWLTTDIVFYSSTSLSITHKNFDNEDYPFVVDIDGTIYGTGKVRNDAVIVNDGVYGEDNVRKFYYDYSSDNLYNASFLLRASDKAAYSIGGNFVDYKRDVYYDDYTQNIWLLTNNYIYSSASKADLVDGAPEDVTYTFSYTDAGIYNPNYFPTFIAGLDDLFLVKDNVTYLLQVINNNGNTELYLPENKENNFYEPLIDLLPLNSTTLLAITKNSMWEISNTGDVDDKLLPLYKYVKTKLNLTTVENSEATIAYDGATILVPTYQGLASLSYNQIISTPEQIVAYLSDNIYKRWLKYVSGNSIGFCNYKYYLFVYSINNPVIWVYDYRSNSWWHWSFDKPVKFMANLDNSCFIGFDDELCGLTENKLSTNWFIKSQKLHLNVPTRFKQIRKFTIYCNGEQHDNTVMNLQFTNYRKRMFKEDTHTVDFDIDFLRTYIRHVNFTDVLYFQYTLSSNEVDPRPLELTGVSINYKVGGEVK